VYCAANIIKSWLRALPEPLLTFSMYDAWIAAQEDPKALHDLVQKLPKANAFVLSALIRLMKDISVYSDVTRMTSNNLAIVIAPNILYRRGDEMNISQGPTTVVDTLILNYEEIFSEVIKKEAANEEFTQEVERNCHNTLRKRASKLLQNVNSSVGGSAPTTGESKKQHHSSSTQSHLMSIFVRGNGNSSSSSTPSSPASSADIPPPSLLTHKVSSPSTLSSSMVSETVNELLKYTSESATEGITSPKSSGKNADVLPPAFDFDPQTLLSLKVPPEDGSLPAEFDVSDINIPGDEPPPPPPPDFDVSDISLPPETNAPQANNDILPPPLPPMDDVDIPPPPLPVDEIPPPPPLP